MYQFNVAPQTCDHNDVKESVTGEEDMRDVEVEEVESRPGEHGFSKCCANKYAHFGTEIMGTRSERGGRVLLTSHFEAFDPGFLKEQGIAWMLTGVYVA
jgi:hypothetical protein